MVRKSPLLLMASLIPSQTVTHSLYHLATYPEYLQPLREEIESVIQEQGWSKAAIAKMMKLDRLKKQCDYRQSRHVRIQSGITISTQESHHESQNNERLHLF